MANIKSQIKRIRVSERQRLRNKSVRSYIRTCIRKFEAAVEEGNKGLADESLRVAIKALDSAASKGVIHKNNVANKKSQLARAFNSLTTA